MSEHKTTWRPWWHAYGPGGERIVGGPYEWLVVAMRVARQGLPWFEAERLGARVEPTDAR